MCNNIVVTVLPFDMDYGSCNFVNKKIKKIGSGRANGKGLKKSVEFHYVHCLGMKKTSLCS